MAITPDWATKTFSVPQADLTPVSGTLYDMQTETYFRAAINAIMASEDGIVFQPPIDHNTEYTVAGVTYARKIEIINGYSITFTPDTQWTARLQGSNNNLFDVENGILNQNQVQVIPNNSAGLQTIASGSGLSAAEQAMLARIEKYLRNKQHTNPVTGKVEQFDDSGTVVEYEAPIYSGDGTTPYDGTQPIVRRDRYETP